MISSVSATSDIEADMNQTLNVDESPAISQEDSVSDDNLSAQENGDVLSATTIYFDASARFDGDGSQSKPYKYYDTDKIPFGATVYFAAGVYDVESTLTISSSLNYKTTFIGAGNQNTILKGTNSILGFKIRDNSNFVLKDIAIDGARINNNGNLEATNAAFTNNSNRFSTIYSTSTIETTLKLTNCVFQNNYASELGGSINVYNGQVVIANCIFTNSSSNSFGGAIEVRNSRLTVTNSRFDSVKSQHGGAIYSYNGDATITGSTFNRCTSEIFGGVVACEYTRLIIDGCNFTNYQSLTDGGGVVYSIDSSSDISRSSFINGSAYFGGAICNLHANMNVTSCTFVNNTAEYYGGSIYNMYSTVRVDGNTFKYSSAKSRGGAIITRFADSFIFTSNVFERTYAPFGPIIFVDGDEEPVYRKNNVFREVYRLEAVYTGYVDGEPLRVESNRLTFSVSNDGEYLPAENDPTSPTSPYVNINIVSTTSNSINTRLNQTNVIVFNILKKYPNVVNGKVEIFRIGETGYNDSLAVIDLEDRDYSNENLFNITFEQYLLNFENDYLYINRPASSVPVLNPTIDMTTGSIPSSYDSRDYGYITPVKDQKSGGNCWAFGGLATLEACLKKATGITYDFSEENVKNLMAEFSLFGWTGTTGGGNDEMVWAYLASWFGPVYDEYDLYDEYSSLSVLYNPALHIQNIYTISASQTLTNEEIRNIKRAIMDYGAVTMTTVWSSTENHCMSIVGWDDNFRGYDYFGTYTQGAWIVKNSYGPDWQYDGYLYISFNRYIYDLYTFVFSSEDRGYSEIYQYDYSGLTNYYPTDSGNYKNRFTSKGNDILSAVSTYFQNPTSFTVKIYKNGNQVTNQSGSASAGYNVITLNNEIQLSKGDVFEVEFLCANSKTVPYCQANYINKETFAEGQSFMKFYGEWTDMYTLSTMYPKVACIKAFTRPSSLGEIEININPFNHVKINEEISIVANLPQNVEGLVTFAIDDEIHYAIAKNGHAILNVAFDSVGTKRLSASYKSSLEKSNTVSFSFDVEYVVQPNVTASVLDVTKYYGGSEKFTATLFDNGLPLHDVEAIVGVDGKSYPVTTNSYGEIVLDLDLEPGIYTVHTFYNSKIFSSKITVKSTIGATDSSGEFLNTVVNATFIDSNGNLVQSGRAIFKVNGREVMGTITNGLATATLNLNAGNYTVYIINPSTGEQIQKNLYIARASPDFLISLYQDGNIVSIYADLPFISTGYVTLACNDQNAFSPINSSLNVNNRGYTTLEISDLPIGNHVMTAYYEGDDNYKSAFYQQEFTVVESHITITAEDSTYYYGNPNNKYYVYVENNGMPVMRSVTITINGWKNVVTDNMGHPYIRVWEKPGVYPVLIEYGGESITRTITVESTILAEGPFSYEYRNSTISATFLDVNGNILKNSEVIIQIDDDEYYAVTDSNGHIAKDIDLDVGSYEMTIINPVTSEEFKTQLNITKIIPQLDYVLKEKSDSYAFETVMSRPAVGGSLIYTFEGKEYTIKYSNGFSDFIIHTNHEGDYDLSVRFTGDSNLNATSRTFTLHLKNKADIISAYDTTVGYGLDGRVSITLLYAGGNAKANSKITLVVNGASTILYTNSYGSASYLVNLNAGTYALQMSSDNYGQRTIILTVKKTTPQLKASKATYKAKVKTKKYKATFKLPKRNLNHYKLTLKVKGKKYSAYTNAKGQATFKITKLKKKGTFKAVITFTGDRNLNKVTKTVKIRVK